MARQQRGFDGVDGAVSEEATKSRAPWRFVALWFALATVLGILEGYLAVKGWRGFDLLFTIVLSVSAVAFLGTGRRTLPNGRFLTVFVAGAVWYVLVLGATLYLSK